MPGILSSAELTGRSEEPNLKAASFETESRGKFLAALQKSVRPCTELETLPIPRREPLLGNWFFEGDLGFVFAPRGLGKTWLSLGIGTSLASGRECGPWTANGSHRVLYIDGEMPLESIASRINGMGADERLTVLNHEALFHLGDETLNLADPTQQDVLKEYVLDNGVKVLILDNLSCLFSGVKENEADAWEPVKRWLLTLRRHRVAVVLVHHAGRNKEMRGTSRREDDVFWIIRLDEIEGEEREGARFLSRFTKDRNSRIEQPAIEWSFRTNKDGSVQIQTREASTMEVFRQWIADGLTGAEDIAREMGVSKGTVSKMATKAIAQGRLTKNGRRYALVD